MCGITGFTNFAQDYENNHHQWLHTISQMTNTLYHRGPDNQGIYLKKNTVLGHTRLAIRDIEKGSQPMVKTISDREYAICYNGEIYNAKELKKELEALGYAFETACDTEIILMGFIHYGTDFINKLNGIFSFAFWDNYHQRLFLIRDRVGIKPLFYTLFDNTLIFASEIKSILKFPHFKPQLDTQGLQEILGIGPARTAGCGVFKGICDVLPGHYMIFDHSGIKEHQYWDLQSYEHTDDYETTVDKVRFLLKDALEKQMVSDVPVCSFLSGGVDSSVVTALAANYLKENNNQQMHTFSFDFSGNDQHFQANNFQPDRDRPWVEKMVAYSQTKHTFLECNNETLADYLDKAVDAKDLPGMADVDSSLLYFCEQVKKTHKVTLTGECADEIFGGYPWFHRQEMFDTPSFPWSSNINARQVMIKDDLIHDLDLQAYSIQKYQQTIDKVPILEGESATEKRRRELAYLNIKWFMATLLERMDRTSMYSGLEARVPFADHRIMEYVFNVPWSIKYKDNTVKHLLRKASEGYLPNEVLYRRKSPYPKTYNPEYEAILTERFQDILANKNEPLHNVIDTKKAFAFLDLPSNNKQPWYGQLMAGPQMIAYMLQINYWLKNYHIKLL